MEIKLGSCNLRQWQNGYDWESKSYKQQEIPIRTRVCSASNRKWVGIIVAMSDPVDRKMYRTTETTKEVLMVTVFWQTGPNKGQTQQKDTSDLVNYDAYKACIAAEIKKLEDVEAEADKTGL